MSLHKNVVAHDNETVRHEVKDWEREPRLFLLGNFDGAMITMGSSPRFPMYDNDFGWGKPLAIRSDRANKFNSKILAFLGREANGSTSISTKPITNLSNLETQPYPPLPLSTGHSKKKKKTKTQNTTRIVTHQKKK